MWFWNSLIEGENSYRKSSGENSPSKLENRKILFTWFSVKRQAGVMGIKGLMGFLNDHAPHGVKETKMEAMTGRTLAIDASMSIYQFLAAVRQGADHSK